MLRKDYIVRQFEEFGKFMSIIFSLKNDNKHSELEELINTSASKFTNIEVCEVEKMADNNLLDELTTNFQLKETNLKMLADLLYEKGIGYSKQFRDTEADNTLHKSFLIYEFILTNSMEIDYSLDTHFKLVSLKKLLNI